MAKYRDDLTIEIYVSHEPGSLSVQSYSDGTTQTLDQAIAEAQGFIKDCRQIKRHIDRHGLGTAPARTPQRLPPGVNSLGELAAQTWETVMGDSIKKKLLGRE